MAFSEKVSAEGRAKKTTPNIEYEAVLLSKAQELGLVLSRNSPEIKKIIEAVKDFEKNGVSLLRASGSLELLIRRGIDQYRAFFKLSEYQVYFRSVCEQEAMLCEAKVKLNVDGSEKLTGAEGRGVVNALDLALRKALEEFYPDIAKISLSNYEVTMIDGQSATAARILVKVETTYRGVSWTTLGVSTNINKSSFDALVHGFDVFLHRYNMSN